MTAPETPSRELTFRTDVEQMARELAELAPRKLTQQEEWAEQARHNEAMARLLGMRITI